MIRVLLVIVAILPTFLGASTQAQVLLTDQFTEGSPQTPATLTNQPPTYAASSTTTEAFNSYATITTNGTEALLPNLGSQSQPYAAPLAYIDIPSSGLSGSDLIVGRTYVLSFNLSETSGTSGVAYAGFGTFDSTYNVPYQNGNEGSLYFFDNGDNSYIVANSTADNGTAANPGGSINFVTPAIPTGSASVPVSLKITAGAHDVDTVSATINGIQVLAPTTETLAPTSEVFLSDLTASGTVSNLVLTPEPSTYALLLAGIAALACCARRIRSVRA